MTILTTNTEQLRIEVANHLAADAVIQGDYWDGQRGCFIGCLAHSDNAAELERQYGFPLPLVMLCERIFEQLPIEEAKLFFAAIPDAIGRDGRDLSRVVWQFLAAELQSLPPHSEEFKEVVDPVIAGLNLLAAGQEWPDVAKAAKAAKAAMAAADRAWDAAETALIDAESADTALFRAIATATNAAVSAAADPCHLAADWAATAANWLAQVAWAAARATAESPWAAAFDAIDAANRRQRDLLLQLLAEA
jgi:hypothetical protein